MTAAARLRLVYDAADPRVAVAAAPDVAPVARLDLAPRRGDRVLVGVLASICFHAGLIAAWMDWSRHEEALSQGGSETEIVLDGVSVVLLDSAASAPMPEARRTEAAQSEPVAVANVATPADMAARPSRDDGSAAVPPATVQTEARMVEPATAADAKPSESETQVTIVAGADARMAATAAPSVLPGPMGEAQAAPATAARAAVSDRAAAGVDAEAMPAASETQVAIAAEAESRPVVASRPVAPADVLQGRAAADAKVNVPADQKLARESANAVPATGDTQAVTVARAEVQSAVGEAAVASATVAPNKAAVVVEATASVAAARSLRPVDTVVRRSVEGARSATAVNPQRAMPVAPDRAIAGIDATPSPAAQASVAEAAGAAPTAGKAGSGGASAGEAGAASSSGYEAKLAAHLRAFRSFPEAARQQGLAGTAIVRFTVNRNGGVTGVAVARSSGHGVLDGAAVAMVRRASPFPPIPAGLGVASVTISAPVRFDFR